MKVIVDAPSSRSFSSHFQGQRVSNTEGTSSELEMIRLSHLLHKEANSTKQLLLKYLKNNSTGVSGGYLTTKRVYVNSIQ